MKLSKQVYFKLFKDQHGKALGLASFSDVSKVHFDQSALLMNKFTWTHVACPGFIIWSFISSCNSSFSLIPLVTRAPGPDSYTSWISLDSLTFSCSDSWSSLTSLLAVLPPSLSCSHPSVPEWFYRHRVDRSLPSRNTWLISSCLSSPRL